MTVVSMQIMTSYTPVHSHAKTLTYRVEVNTDCWEKFFTRQPDLSFLEKYGPSGLFIDPRDEKSMIELHKKIQNAEGDYYLSDSVMLDFGEERRTVSISPVDGIIIDFYEED